MHPILFKAGPLTFYSYGAMLVLAFVAATWLAGRHARRLSPPALRAISAEQLLDFSSIALVGGLVGARALFVALHWDAFSSEPLEILAVWHGGLVWYGGFLGGLLGGACYVRAQRLSFLRVLDQFIPFLTLGHAIGRVGCLLNGCCYGKPTDAWCGVTFPEQSVAVFPTQLVESAGLLLLYVGLRALQRPGLLQYPGRVFGAYLAGYGALRFALEFTRGDQAPWGAGLTLQQAISMAILAVGGVLLLRPRTRMRHDATV